MQPSSSGTCIKRSLYAQIFPISRVEAQFRKLSLLVLFGTLFFLCDLGLVFLLQLAWKSFSDLTVRQDIFSFLFWFRDASVISLYACSSSSLSPGLVSLFSSTV